MIINVYWSSCKVPLFLSDFNEILIFWTDFRKILKYQILLKLAVCDSTCSVRTYRQTWRN